MRHLDDHHDRIPRGPAEICAAHGVLLPLDFSWAVRRAMRRIRPGLLVLTELELWPNLILTVKHLRAHAVAVINGRMSDRSMRGYQRIRWLMALLLRNWT
jgi:3-deoxy-D-manno-octulosonic-acid transferase